MFTKQIKKRKAATAFVITEVTYLLFEKLNRLIYSIEQHNGNFHTRTNLVKHTVLFSVWFKKLKVRTWPFAFEVTRVKMKGDALGQGDGGNQCIRKTEFSCHFLNADFHHCSPLETRNQCQ